jgi:hypothetical protein
MTIDLNVGERIYKCFFIFKIFLYLFRGPLSMDPHSKKKQKKFKNDMHLPHAFGT